MTSRSDMVLGLRAHGRVGPLLCSTALGYASDDDVAWLWEACGRPAAPEVTPEVAERRRQNLAGKSELKFVAPQTDADKLAELVALMEMLR